MRPCTDDELRALLEKLMKFIGKNVELLLHKAEEPHCFRVHKGRIYYVSEKLMRMATNFKGSDLLAMGTCFAKITHSGKIHLQITCVDHLAKHALHKVWLKASAEQSFLYGNHVTKQGLGRITDAAPQLSSDELRQVRGDVGEIWARYRRDVGGAAQLGRAAPG